MRLGSELTFQQCYDTLQDMADHAADEVSNELLHKLGPVLMRQRQGQVLLLKLAIKDVGDVAQYICSEGLVFQGEDILAAIERGSQHQHLALLRGLAKANDAARHLLMTSSLLTTRAFHSLFGSKPYLTALPILKQLAAEGQVGITKYLKQRLLYDVVPAVLIEKLYPHNDREQWLEMLPRANTLSASYANVRTVMHARLAAAKMDRAALKAKRQAAVCITGSELHAVYRAYRSQLKTRWMTSSRMTSFKAILSGVEDSNKYIDATIYDQLSLVNWRTIGYSASHRAQAEIQGILQRNLKRHWLQKAVVTEGDACTEFIKRLAVAYPKVDVVLDCLVQQRFQLLTDIYCHLQDVDKILALQTLELHCIEHDWTIPQLCWLYRFYRNFQTATPKSIMQRIAKVMQSRVEACELPKIASDAITLLFMMRDAKPHLTLSHYWFSVFEAIQLPLTSPLSADLLSVLELAIEYKNVTIESCLRLAQCLQRYESDNEFKSFRNFLLKRASRKGSMRAYQLLYDGITDSAELYNLAKQGHRHAIRRLFVVVAQQGAHAEQARCYLRQYFQGEAGSNRRITRMHYALRWSGIKPDDTTIPEQHAQLRQSLLLDRRSLLFSAQASAPIEHKKIFLNRQLEFHLQNLGLGGYEYKFSDEEEAMKADGYCDDLAIRHIVALFGHYIDQLDNKPVKSRCYRIECGLNEDIDLDKRLKKNGHAMLERLECGDTVTLTLGYATSEESHAVRLAFCKLGNHYYMAYANRGYWANRHASGLHFFEVTKRDRLSDVGFLRQLHADADGEYLEDFSAHGAGLGADLGLRRVGYLSKTNQGSGNCALASAYHAALLAMIFDYCRHKCVSTSVKLTQVHLNLAIAAVKPTYKKFRAYGRMQSLRILLKLADPAAAIHLDAVIMQPLLRAVVDYCSGKQSLFLDVVSMLDLVASYYQYAGIADVDEAVKAETLQKIAEVCQSIDGISESDSDSESDDASILSL